MDDRLIYDRDWDLEEGSWDDDQERSDSPDRDDHADSTPRKECLKLDTICVREFARLKLPPRKMVLDPILPEGGLAMLFAGRGIGKTHVALGIAHAVSCGGEFLRWRAETPRNVLYVDGEMPQQAIQERLVAAMEGGRRPQDGPLRLLCMDRQPLGTSINLAEPKHQRLIDSHLTDVDLLVLDNLSTLVNGGPENEAESWIPVQKWLLDLRRRGITVLIVHHASRGGNARGSSKREDVLDTVIQLKHPVGYDPADGARFEVHLTKARGIFGEDAMAFEARLEVENGAAKWVCSDVTDDDEGDRQRVQALRDQGKSQREIARETGMSKSAVNRKLKKSQKQAASWRSRQMAI